MAQQPEAAAAACSGKSTGSSICTGGAVGHTSHGVVGRNSHQFGDTTHTKVFVGGLAWETQKDTMSDYFEQFGEILEAVVITDKNTGRSKGYGFVTFKDAESARRACIDAAPIIDGRRANCNLAALGLPSPRSQFPQGIFRATKKTQKIPFATNFLGSAATGTPVYNWTSTYGQPGSANLYQQGFPYAVSAICQYGYPSYSMDSVYPQFNACSGGFTQMNYGTPRGLASQYSSAFTQAAAAAVSSYNSTYATPALPSNYSVQAAGPQMMQYVANQSGVVGVFTTVPAQYYTGVLQPISATATPSTGLVPDKPSAGTSLALLQTTHSLAAPSPPRQQLAIAAADRPVPPDQAVTKKASVQLMNKAATT